MEVDAFFLGTVGLSLDAYHWMCPYDLYVVAKGYESRIMGDWQRTLMVVNCWVDKPITLDQLRGKTPGQIRSKEEWESFKKSHFNRV